MNAARPIQVNNDLFLSRWVRPQAFVLPACGMAFNEREIRMAATQHSGQPPTTRVYKTRIFVPGGQQYCQGGSFRENANILHGSNVALPVP